MMHIYCIVVRCMCGLRESNMVLCWELNDTTGDMRWFWWINKVWCIVKVFTGWLYHVIQRWRHRYIICTSLCGQSYLISIPSTCMRMLINKSLLELHHTLFPTQYTGKSGLAMFDREQLSNYPKASYQPKKQLLQDKSIPLLHYPLKYYSAPSHTISIFKE